MKVESGTVMQLGVLFCDQVGSTDLLTRLGDALAEEIRLDIFEALHQSVELSRGEVIKSSGDGLMVVFSTGADDALACGRLMVQKVIRLTRRSLFEKVAFKVGVSVGPATFDEGDWYGASVNLAARLCAAAAPSQVLTATATLDVSREDRGRWEPLGALELKGFPDPIPVSGCTIADPEVPTTALPAQFDLQGSLPLVGRAEVLGELRRAWGEASEGRSVALSLSGTPGMGVSRILAEVANGVAAGLWRPPGVVLSARGGAPGTWAAQLVRSYAAIAKRDELRHAVGVDAAALSGICPLVGLRLGVAPAPVSGEAEVGVVGRLLGRLGADAPVLVLVDGMDAEAQVTLASTIPRQRCLVVAGGRTGEVGRPLVLGALSHAEVAQLVTAVVPGNAPWFDELSALMLAETGGVPRDLEAAIDELVRQGAQGPLTRQRALDAVRNAVPYRGLQVFTSDDAVRFYGRERVVAEVLGALGEHSVVLVGSSGSGKSSVMRAGCLPRLARQGTNTVVLSPGDHPLRAFATVWSQRFGAHAGVLEAQLRVDPTAHLGLMRNASQLVVVAVDQLEECFTLCVDDAERSAFLDALAVSRRGFRLLASLRGDFYGRLSEHSAFAELLQVATVIIPPASRDDLREVIEAPARAAHLDLEAGLADLILGDVADRPGGLPLLSHALTATWQRRHGHVLMVADYQSAGGATGAIARTADDLFDSLSASQQQVAKRILLRLTALGQGLEDYRRRVPRRLLLAADTAESTAVLDSLTASRLVTAGTDTTGEEVEELAHEALLREWPRLRAWLDENRDELHAIAHLEAAAREWDDSGRADADLYGGRRLEYAEEIEPDKLNELERDYLLASVARREAEAERARRSQRRLRTFATVSTVLLVVALIAGLVALGQRNTAESQRRADQAETTLARAGELSSEATSLQRTQPSLSLLLAVEAHRLSHSNQTLAGLLSSIWGSPHLSRIEQSFGSNLTDFELSPDGRTAATAYTDGSIRLWAFRTERALTPRLHIDSHRVELAWVNADTVAAYWSDGRIRLVSATSGKQLPVRFLDVPSPELSTLQPSVRFSPDGKQMAVLVHDPSTQHTSVELWSTDGGAPLREFSTGERQGIFQNYVFAPSGTEIVTLVDDGTVHFLDVATGVESRPPISVPGANDDGFAFSLDGSTLALGSLDGHVTRVNVLSGSVVGSTLVGNNGNGSPTEFAIDALAFSPDGRYLAATEANGNVVLWRTADGSEVDQPFTGHSTTSIYSLRFSADGAQFVTANANEAITWDVAGRGVLRGAGAEFTQGSFAAVLDRVRHRLYIVGGNGALKVWNTKSLRLESSIDKGVIEDIEVQPSTGDIAEETGTGKVLLLKGGPDPKVFAQLSVAGTDLTAAFSPSGNELAVYTLTGSLETFDLRHPARPVWSVQVPAPYAYPASTVSWTADGNFAFVTGLGGVVRIDAHGNHRLTDLDRNGDGSLYVLAEPDPANGEIVAADQDGHISFGTKDGTPTKRTDIIANGRVEDAAISPDGRLLAASGDEGQLELWYAHSGRLLLAPITVAQGFSEVAFLDNERLIYVGENDPVFVDLDPTRLVASACRMVGRNLTHQEFAQYLPFETYHRICSQWPAE